MPELFDVDRAFDDLVHDVGTHTRPMGADRVVRTVRRRRTTKVAVGAVVLLVGAGAVAWRHPGQDHAIDPANGLPAPHALTTDVMDRATAGWVSDWIVPTDPEQVGDDLQTAGGDCLESLLDDDGIAEDDLGSGPTGSSLFISGRSVALAQAGRATSPDVAHRFITGSSPSKPCRNVQRLAPSPDVDLVTATSSDAHGGAVLAAVRWRDRFAFAVVSSPASGVTPSVQDAVGQAMLAAIQDDSTITEMSPLLQQMRDGVGGSASGHASASADDVPSYSMTAPTADQLRRAFGSWAPGYDPDGAAARPLEPPRCLDDLSSNGSGETAGSAAMVGLSNYASRQESLAALRTAAQQLTDCGFQVQGPSTDDLLVASRGGGQPATLWFQRVGSHIATLQVDGWSDPPQAVTGAVGRLLLAAAVTAKAG